MALPNEHSRPGAAPGAWTEIATYTVLGRYFRETAQPIYSLLFLIPLLIAYELIAVVVNFDRTLQIRNAADIMVKNVLLAFGIRSMLGFMLAVVLIAIVCALVALRESRGPIKGRYFLGMLGESWLYASVLGTFATRFTDLLLGVQAIAPHAATSWGVGFSVANPGLSQLMIALGAGVYEEIVFRVLLISMLLYGFEQLSGHPRLRWLDGRWGSALAAVTAALLFSAFHYVGTHGEAFVWTTFVYRYFAGLFLAGIYVTRGVGVAAWSHAIYDVRLLVGMS